MYVQRRRLAPRPVIREIERGPHGVIVKSQLVDHRHTPLTTSYVVKAPRNGFDGDQAVTLTRCDSLQAARAMIRGEAA